MIHVDYTTRGTDNKTSVDIEKYIKLSNFCTPKEECTGMSASYQREKIFTDIYRFGKGLIFKMYKELLQVNTKTSKLILKRTWVQRSLQRRYRNGTAKWKCKMLQPL